MVRDTVVDIALGFDARYAPYARVTIESVLSCRDGDQPPLRFWLIVADDVDAAVCRNIGRQVGSRADVTFVECGGSTRATGPSVNPDLAYLSDAMYLRLYLPHLLPQDVDRVIYLDSDVLCTSPLTPLATCDLGGRTVGAVRDAYTRRLCDSGGLRGLAGLDPTADYFNSGVLIMDLPAWRVADVTGRCLAFLGEHAGQLLYPDQDALNVVLYRDWLRLPKEWNYMWPWRLERTAGGRLRDAHLIHSVGPLKYWHRQFIGSDVVRYYAHLRRAVETADARIADAVRG